MCRSILLYRHYQVLIFMSVPLRKTSLIRRKIDTATLLLVSTTIILKTLNNDIIIIEESFRAPNPHFTFSPFASRQLHSYILGKIVYYLNIVAGCRRIVHYDKSNSNIALCVLNPLQVTSISSIRRRNIVIKYLLKLKC